MTDENLNEFVWALVDMARRNQDYEYHSGSDSPEYDQGYEAGRFGAGDELEDLLRRNGLWSDQ